jgi:hypothetical protein
MENIIFERYEVFKYKGNEYFVDKNIIIKDDDDEDKIWYGIKELTTKKYVGLINGIIIHFFKDEEDETKNDEDINNLKKIKLLENLQIISIEEIKFLKNIKDTSIKEIINQHIKNLRDRAKIILELLDTDYSYYNKNDIRYKNEELKEIRKKKRLLLLNIMYGL